MPATPGMQWGRKLLAGRKEAEASRAFVNHPSPSRREGKEVTLGPRPHSGVQGSCTGPLLQAPACSPDGLCFEELFINRAGVC